MVPVYLVLCLGTAREAGSIVQNAWQLPVFWSPSIVILSAALPALPELCQALGVEYLIDPAWRGVAGRLAFVCIGNWFLASILGAIALWKYQGRQEATGWLVSGGLLLYVSVATGFWWIIRQIGEPKLAMLHVIGIALVTKMADSGAYFAGKNLGRTPLAPVLSPKKTWEGLVGGWITACLAAVLFFTWIHRANVESTLGWKVTGAVLLGTALTWFGLIGDLIESMMKRSGAVKDSGGSFAGLGGVWDVTDSLIPAGVVGLVAILLGWI
jgi:CDP-diglyceride synthetase